MGYDMRCDFNEIRHRMKEVKTEQKKQAEDKKARDCMIAFNHATQHYEDPASGFDVIDVHHALFVGRRK